ncbi:MAG: branched-chain amino acid ABC transporter permease [Erysipelotrichaceae bacterium]|nr:branched-chain amino acid ABC transporter permease [Erysipelotrichaceae bacterium]MDY5251529.1 branched-chain amino acid ABC transporter permease [Erysipelotrichaceae bacterium]
MKVAEKYKNLGFWPKMIMNFALILAVFIIISVLSSAKIISNYYQGIILSICINVILVVSLNITTGFLGQLTLGHAGFMAVGAYSGAFLSKNLMGSLPDPLIFLLAIIVGGIVAMIFGVIVGVPTLRLKGDYLAIITLAFGEVIKNILLNLKIVGGASGYIGIPRYTNFLWAYWLAIITVVLSYALINSRHGRAIISIREDEIASESMGVDTKKYKILAFIFAAFFAGVAGCLYAHYMGILEPKTFKFDKSIEILVMVVLGGMGNIKGSIISAIILTVLPQLLVSVSGYRMLLYALALIIMMLFKYHPTLVKLTATIKSNLKKVRG